MKIEQTDINELKPYENNAKIHTPEQIEQIKASILEFGNNDPIAIDENGVVIEGHGRLEALQALGYKKVEVIRLTHLTDEQKRAYILVHNKLTMNTGFDLELLEEELESITNIDMSDFDFDLDFSINTDMSFEDDEQAASVRGSAAVQRCERGQLWQLGRHRLYCGDSTSEKDVDELIAGEEMDLCVTDPPYNVGFCVQDEKEAKQRKRVIDTRSILNDEMDDEGFYNFLIEFYSQMLRVLKPGGSFYIFHADTEGLKFRAALQETGGVLKQTLIWAKNIMVLGRQDYQWKHEPILYGWKEGAGHYFTQDRCQTTLFENRPDLEAMTREELLAAAQFMLASIDNYNTTVVHEKKPAKSELHPTMKPVPLCARLVRNSSRRNEKVIDFFGGSGSTLMACEEAGRTAYIMELDPGYCDVILARWEEATGGKAELINGRR